MKTLLFGLCLALGGCALTSKADALDVRWYSPETVKPQLTSSGGTRADGPALTLGRVSSGVNLREKIAYRDTAFEMGFYDDRRWTERPEVYVRRELSRTLFEERGMKRVLAGQAPVLEVEVLAFEELRDAHAARVQLKIIVHDDVRAMLEKTITVDRPIAGKETGAFVQAMAQALDVAAEEAAVATESVLHR